MASVAIITFIALSAIICSYPCAMIETERFVHFEPNSKSVYFVVRGFYACPVTAEGSFPSWSNSVRAKFTSDKVFQSHSGSFVLGADFTSQYGELESGRISFDSKAKSVTLEGKYIPSYSWNRALGSFPFERSSNVQ